MPSVIVPVLTTALGGGVLAAAVAQVVVGLGLSYVSQSLFGRDATSAAADPVTQTSRTNGTVAPQRVLLGRVSTVGHDMFPPYCHGRLGVAVRNDNGGQYMTIGVALSDLPVNGLHSVTIQDLEFVVGTHLVDNGNSAGFTIADGLGDEYSRYHGKMWVKFYNGSQTQADPFMRSVFATHEDRPYTEDMIYEGGAYALLTVKYDNELWTNLSDIGWIVDGVSVDGAFTKNPVKLANYIARGITLPSGDVYGPQMPFDDDWLYPAITACNDAGFTAGLEVQVGGPNGDGLTPLDAIEDLLEACAGRAWDDGGTLKVTALDGGLPVSHITDTTILVSQGRTAEKASSLKDRTNSVTITHPNSEELWKLVAAPTFTDDGAVEVDGERLPVALTYPAVTASNQAQTLAGMLVADAQRVRLHTFALPLRYGYLTCQDKITWSSDIHGYDGKSFRVESISRLPTYTVVTVRETDPDDFNPEAVSLTPYVPTIYTPSGPTALVTGATFTAKAQESADGNLAAGVVIRVDNNPASAQSVRWQIRARDSEDYLSGTFEPDELSTFVVLAAGVAYEGRAKFVASDRTALWSAWSYFLTPDVRSSDMQELADEIEQALSDAQAVAAAAAAEAQQAIQDTADVRADHDALIEGLTEGTIEGAIQQARTELQDDINAVSGEITDIEGLSVDGDTAFGTLMQQLAVNADGTSATITSHASAVSDLDGFSSAYAGLTVDTDDGNIAGFRATSFANPDGTGNGVLELLGDVVAEGSLSTNRLVVGLGRNLLSNTDFSDGLQGWIETFGLGGGGTATLSLRSEGVWSAAHFPVMQVYQGSSAADGYQDVEHRPIFTDGTVSVGVPVEAGQWLEASVKASVHRCVFELRIRFFDASGAHLAFSGVLASADSVTSSSADPELWPTYWGKVQTPSGAAYATVMYRKRATVSDSDSYLIIHKPQLAISHASATQPAPYSPGGTTVISGGKIMTDAIIGRHITAGEIAAAKIDVVDFNSVGVAVFNDTLRSSNFISGDDGDGWAVYNNGFAEFNNIKIRRQLEVASGSIDVGTFSVSSTGTGAILSPSWAAIGHTIFVETTPVAVSAWMGANRTYLVTAGMSGKVVTDSDFPPDVYWGWVGTILPLTRWSGDQSLRLKFDFWNRRCESVENCVINWMIYEVS